MNLHANQVKHYEKKMKKTKVKFCLITTLALLSALFVYTRLTFYLYEIKYSNLLLQNSNTFPAGQTKLTLFSDCYCQKDIVHVTKHENFYEIVIESPIEKTANSYRLEKDYFENLFFTCDLYTVLRRGPSQKIISYSVNDADLNSENFLKSIDEKVSFSSAHYPEWVLRFYHRNGLSHSVKCQSQCGGNHDNVDFCNVNKLPVDFGIRSWDASYILQSAWRLLPLGDSFVSVFTSRFTDECASSEQIRNDVKWLETSDAQTQLILDNFLAHHYSQIDDKVELSGFKNGKNRQLALNLFSVLSDEYLANNWYWPDEKTVFRQFVLPLLNQSYSFQVHSDHKCLF